MGGVSESQIGPPKRFEGFLGGGAGGQGGVKTVRLSKVEGDECEGFLVEMANYGCGVMSATVIADNIGLEPSAITFDLSGSYLVSITGHESLGWVVWRPDRSA